MMSGRRDLEGKVRVRKFRVTGGQRGLSEEVNLSRGLKKGKEMSHVQMLKNSQWKDHWRKQEWSQLLRDCQGDQVTRAEPGEERKGCLGMELWRGARYTGSYRPW